jgi:hypothetical protein
VLAQSFGMLKAVIQLQDLDGSAFSTARRAPWAMVALGPVYVGLHRSTCHQCDEESLVRTYGADKVALLHEDSTEQSALRQELGRADAIALALKAIESPCWVTSGPLQIKGQATPPAAFVREFSKRVSTTLFLPMAQHKLFQGLLGSVCPSCQAELGPQRRPNELTLAVTDTRGDFDMQPMPAVGWL